VDEFGRNRGEIDALGVLIRLGRGIFASLSLSHVEHSVSSVIMVFIFLLSIDDGDRRSCRSVRGLLADAGFTKVAVVVFVQSLSLRCVYCRSHIMIGVGRLVSGLATELNDTGGMLTSTVVLVCIREAMISQ
jgi:hypothetical protein